MVLHSTLEERRKSAGLKDCTFSPAINPDRFDGAAVAPSPTRIGIFAHCDLVAAVLQLSGPYACCCDP